MPQYYNPSSLYGSNPPRFPSLSDKGPDPRSRGRAWTEEDSRASEAEYWRHRKEMEELRKQKLAEQQAADEERHANQRAAAKDAYYAKHPEEAVRDLRIQEQQQKDKADRAARQAEADRVAALTPEQRQAEVDARRAQFRQDEAKRYADYAAQQKRAQADQQAHNEAVSKDVYDQVQKLTAADHAALSDKFKPYSISNQYGSAAPDMHQKLEDAQAAQHAAERAAVAPPAAPPTVEAYAGQNTVREQMQRDREKAAELDAKFAENRKPAPAPAPASSAYKMGPATQSASTAFEQARKQNPNLTASDFFASRPDLIAAMQSEQNPQVGWSVNQPKPSTPQFAPRNALGGLAGPAERQYLQTHTPIGGGVSTGQRLNPRTGQLETFADPLGHTMASAADTIGDIGTGIVDAGKYGLDWLAGLLNDRKVQVNKPTGIFDPNLRGLTYDEAAYGPGMGDMSDRSQAFPGGIIPSLQPRVFATPMVFGPYSR
jgi:hypothetical protein